MKNHPYLNLRKRAFTKDVIILGGLEKMAQDDGRLGSRAKDDVLFLGGWPKRSTQWAATFWLGLEAPDH